MKIVVKKYKKETNTKCCLKNSTKGMHTRDEGKNCIKCTLNDVQIQ